MSGTDDFTAFMKARYSEAETLAKATSSEVWAVRQLGRHDSASIVLPRGSGTHGLVLGPAIGTFDGHSRSTADATHAAACDPAHRLADIALKRAILAMHARVESVFIECGTCHETEEGWAGTVPVQWPCPTVRQLGTEFSGHPEYKEPWKP